MDQGQTSGRRYVFARLWLAADEDPELTMLFNSELSFPRFLHHRLAEGK